MKTKDIKDLRTKSEKELTTLLKEKSAKVFTLKLDQTQNKLKNLREIFITRKDVARIKTILKEKELALEVQEKTKDNKSIKKVKLSGAKSASGGEGKK
jgi:large subunit ribosomal protein L29